MRSLARLACLLPLAFTPFLHPQKPATIEFTGTPGLSQPTLLTAAGLPTTPAPITPADLQAAAQRLIDTGLFADVRYASRPGGGTVLFTLTPTPAAQLVPARFTNLVWWTPEQLLPLVGARVPLFTGQIPINGNLQDAVKAALLALLAEKSVPNPSLTVLPVTEPGKDHPVAIAFSLDNPEVVIHSITLAGVSSTEAPHIDLFLRSQTDHPYEDLTTQKALASQLRELYGNDGYLDASLTSLTHSTPTITNNRVPLDLTGTVAEGSLYHLSTLTYTGSDIYSQADFQKQATLHPNDVASEQQLRHTLHLLGAAYFSKGYQDARILAPATKDTTNHTVSYAIRVIPGDQYHLKTVTATGLSDAQRRDFDAAWKLHPGEPYDVTYVTSFLTRTSIRSLMGYSAKYRAVADPDTHLVDLTLTFAQGGTLKEDPTHQVETVTVH